jgi:thymidine kinase
MQEVVWQEGDSIEIIIWDDLTEDEFKQVIHQLESMCTAHPKIKVLLDAGGLKSVKFQMVLDEYDFYKKYKDHLERVAIVSDSKFEAMMTGLFNKFTKAEFRVFPNKKTEVARKWIFPSPLPG